MNLALFIFFCVVGALICAAPDYDAFYRRFTTVAILTILGLLLFK